MYISVISYPFIKQNAIVIACKHTDAFKFSSQNSTPSSLGHCVIQIAFCERVSWRAAHLNYEHSHLRWPRTFSPVFGFVELATYIKYYHNTHRTCVAILEVLECRHALDSWQTTTLKRNRESLKIHHLLEKSAELKAPPETRCSKWFLLSTFYISRDVL